MRLLKNLLGVAALLATCVVLVATPLTPCSSDNPAMEVVYRVDGTCGPAGVITVRKPKDSCAVEAEGAEAVNLPSRGEGSRPGLREGQWSLSGTSTPYLLADGGAVSWDGGTGRCLDTRTECSAHQVDNQHLRLECVADSAPGSVFTTNGQPACNSYGSGLGPPLRTYCGADLTEQEQP